MGTKSKQRGPRVSQGPEQYVMEDGTRLKVPLLPGNMPRLSGVRTGSDKDFLSSNDGKLSKLQQNI